MIVEIVIVSENNRKKSLCRGYLAVMDTEDLLSTILERLVDLSLILICNCALIRKGDTNSANLLVKIVINTLEAARQ